MTRDDVPAPVNWLRDLETQADEALPSYVAGYYAMTAGSGVTHDEGIRDWASPRIRSRDAVDTSAPDIGTPSTAVTVLGTPLRTPVMIAPMAQAHGAHPDAEVALGAAAAASGSLLGVSTHTVRRFDEIAQTGAPWWLQVYVMTDRGLTRHLIERAVAAGARALLLTIDLPTLTTRKGELEPSQWPDATLARRGVNLDSAPGRHTAADRTTAEDVGPDDIGWLQDISGLPVVVKGVLDESYARRCVGAGAAGVLVSTHGGRAIDGSTTSAAALPRIVDALAGTGTEVYADSGLRSGTGVFAALALGARAVFVGRPMLWGLTVDGSRGVGHVIDTLTHELTEAMSVAGTRTVADITSGLLDVRAPVALRRR